MEPGNAVVVRAMSPVENAVLACQPPANDQGRLEVRMRVSGSGAPTDIYFGVDMPDTRTAMCLGRTLCGVRMPSFRAFSAMVNYEYLVMLPDYSE